MPSSFAWTLPGPWPPTRAAATPHRSAALHGVAPRPETMASADPPLAELDERALVDACLASDPRAFDIIVERHRRSVYQLCYRFVGSGSCDLGRRPYADIFDTEMCRGERRRGG